MAPVNPPIYMQANSYSAAHDRFLAASALSFPLSDDETGPDAVIGGTGGGILLESGVGNNVANGCEVFDGTTNNSVRVRTGTIVAHSNETTMPGYFIGHNDATYEIQLTTRPASGTTRKILIYAAFNDITRGQSTSDFVITAVNGTAGTNPSVSQPTSGQHAAWVPLAVLDQSSGVAAPVIGDRRRFGSAQGGVRLHKNSNTIPGGVPGRVKYSVETGQLAYFDATGSGSWKRVMDEEFYKTDQSNRRDRYAPEGAREDTAKRITAGNTGWDPSPQFSTGATTWGTPSSGQQAQMTTPSFKSETGRCIVIVSAAMSTQNATPDNAEARFGFRLRNMNSGQIFLVADTSRAAQWQPNRRGTATWQGIITTLPTSPGDSSDVPIQAEMMFSQANATGGYVTFDQTSLTVIPIQ